MRGEELPQALDTSRRIGKPMQCHAGDDEVEIGVTAGLTRIHHLKRIPWYLAHGLNIRPLGPTLYLMPPYCITDEELTRAYQGIVEGLDRLASGA